MELESMEKSLQEFNMSEPQSSEFFLYQYKISICTKSYSHDWTTCPFAHPTENARRRDPRKFNYYPTPCPDYKKGVCLKGDNCTYSHGVFERWLHPVMFKTRMCAEGNNCKRKCCFFAHSSEELREPEVFSPAQKEQTNGEQDQEVQAPRISNSITRSLGLNPKDPAMVNVQKLLQAFQNKEQQNQQIFQLLQHNNNNNNHSNTNQGYNNQNFNVNQQYDFGLDSQLVNILGLQSGFNDEEITNLQRHLQLVKENNMFQQVLQNSNLQNDFKSQVSSVPEIFNSEFVLQREQLKQQILNDYQYQKFNNLKFQTQKPQDLELGFSKLYLDQLNDGAHNRVSQDTQKPFNLDPSDLFQNGANPVYKQQSSPDNLLNFINEQKLHVNGSQKYLLNNDLGISPHTNGNHFTPDLLSPHNGGGMHSPYQNGSFGNVNPFMIQNPPQNGAFVAQSPHRNGYIAQSPHQGSMLSPHQGGILSPPQGSMLSPHQSNMLSPHNPSPGGPFQPAFQDLPQVNGNGLHKNVSYGSQNFNMQKVLEAQSQFFHRSQSMGNKGPQQLGQQGSLNMNQQQGQVPYHLGDQGKQASYQGQRPSNTLN